jgi:glyoxylase-like metal-dependent hydrolase (beta-lactamase superfamily II)
MVNSLRRIGVNDPLQFGTGCCAEAAEKQLTYRAATRRRFMSCAAVASAAVTLPRGARAEDYPPLTEDLVVQQALGAPIYFVLGHAGVPNTQNDGHTSNAGFVITSEGVIVFDALGTPSLGWALFQKIKAITDKPIKYVILSHYHADHIYGLQAFQDHTDAVILAHEEALKYTDTGNHDDEAAGPRLEQRREALAPWVNAETRIVLPGVVFKVAAEIRLGERQFQIIYAGPAHSMSDLMMLVLPERVLFAGDIVQNGRIPFMASAAVNTKNWLNGLEEVATLAPRFIIPGHGHPATDAQEAIAFTRDYIAFLRRTMGNAVQQWTEFDTAYQAVDWSAYQALPAFAASNRGNAYRVFLDIEAEGFQGPLGKTSP